MNNSPPLQRHLLEHGILNVLVELHLANMCLERPSITHFDRAAVDACAINLNLFFTHSYLPLVTKLFDLLLVLNLCH